MGSLDTLIIGAAATGLTAKVRKIFCCKPPPIMVYQDWRIRSASNHQG